MNGQSYQTAASHTAQVHVSQAARHGQGRLAMNRQFSRKQRRYLSILSGGYCSACGKPLNGDLHADHVKPWAKGGQTALSNGQALCPACNLRKGAKS